MFSFEQVAMFVASADHGSFSAAARSIGKSHSAISIAVTNLEIELGVRLFDRSTKFPTLTTDGERFYQQSLILLRQVERMNSTAQSSINEVEHQLILGLGELIPFQFVENIIETTAGLFPHTKISVLRAPNEQLISGLEEGKINIVVAANHSAMTRVLDFHAIAELPLVCVCSPDSDLADMAIVDNETLLATRQLCCHAMLDNTILKLMAQVSPETWEITDQDDMLKLVEQDLGWAVVPKMLAEERVQLGTLKIFRAEFSHTQQTFLVDLLLAPMQSSGPVQAYLVEQFKSLSV